MKIVYASDVHGRTSHYEELIDLAARESARALVLGGDLLPPPRGLSSPAARTDAAARQRAYLEEELMPRLDAAKRGGREVLLLLGNYDLGALSNADRDEVLDRVHRSLKPGGAFLAKIFTGAESDLVSKELQPYFDKVRRIRPEATRKESFELYLIGKGSKTTEGTP